MALHAAGEQLANISRWFWRHGLGAALSRGPLEGLQAQVTRFVAATFAYQWPDSLISRR
jgi:hypothetical protein